MADSRREYVPKIVYSERRDEFDTRSVQACPLVYETLKNRACFHYSEANGT